MGERERWVAMVADAIEATRFGELLVVVVVVVGGVIHHLMT